MITCKEIITQLIFESQEATSAFFKMQDNSSNYSVEEINRITTEKTVKLGSFTSFMSFVKMGNVKPNEQFCTREDYT